MTTPSTRISRTPASTRNAPRQARSRATVGVIIEAGAQVLGRHGWAGFTTNAVAAVAGVSIGSLYQYFPDKHGLVGAIRTRHFADILAVLERALALAPDVPRCMALLVHGMLDAHRAGPAMHRALLEELPRTTRDGAANADFERRYRTQYRALVSRCCPALADAPTSNTKWMVLTLSAAIEGGVHHAALHGMTDSRACRRELTALAVRYLTASRR